MVLILVFDGVTVKTTNNQQCSPTQPKLYSEMYGMEYWSGEHPDMMKSWFMIHVHEGLNSE